MKNIIGIKLNIIIEYIGRNFRGIFLFKILLYIFYIIFNIADIILKLIT